MIGGLNFIKWFSTVLALWKILTNAGLNRETNSIPASVPALSRREESNILKFGRMKTFLRILFESKDNELSPGLG